MSTFFDAFGANWRRYQQLCKSWISSAEARRLMYREQQDGIFWREPLDTILFLHRVCYCQPDEPDETYVPVWAEDAIEGWDIVWPAYSIEQDESMSDILRAWLEE